MTNKEERTKKLEAVDERLCGACVKKLLKGEVNVYEE